MNAILKPSHQHSSPSVCFPIKCAVSKQALLSVKLKETTRITAKIPPPASSRPECDADNEANDNACNHPRMISTSIAKAKEKIGDA